MDHRKGYLPPEGEDINSSDEDVDESYCDKARYSHISISTRLVLLPHRLCSLLGFRIDLKQTFRQIPGDQPLREIIAKCIDKDSKLLPHAHLNTFLQSCSLFVFGVWINVLKRKDAATNEQLGLLFQLHVSQKCDGGGQYIMSLFTTKILTEKKHEVSLLTGFSTRPSSLEGSVYVLVFNVIKKLKDHLVQKRNRHPY